MNVLTGNGRSDQSRYAADAAPRLLTTMEEYTEMRYDLPALNLLAVPDLKKDATGNWGLNVFRYGDDGGVVALKSRQLSVSS